MSTLAPAFQIECVCDITGWDNLHPLSCMEFHSSRNYAVKSCACLGTLNVVSEDEVVLIKGQKKID